MECSKNRTLCSTPDLSIIHFGCGHIGFRFKSMMLNFQPDDFVEFSSSFQKLNFEKRAVQFPDGRPRMVMNTSRREIQLCFDQSEFNAVKHSLQEAAVMLEVNQILYSEQ